MSKILHTSPLSFNGLRPEMIIAELGITDIEFKNEDLMAYAQKQDADFMTKSPFGQVPLYEDRTGGITIHESRAIARYLVLLHKSPLSPTFESNPQAYADLETALSIEAIRFDPFALAIGFQRVLVPLLGQTPDEAVIAQNKATLRGHLEVIDGILGQRKFMAGEQFTIADVFFVPNVLMLVKAGEWKGLTQGLENWRRWWGEVSERESFKVVRRKIDETYGPDRG